MLHHHGFLTSQLHIQLQINQVRITSEEHSPENANMADVRICALD